MTQKTGLKHPGRTPSNDARRVDPDHEHEADRIKSGEGEGTQQCYDRDGGRGTDVVPQAHPDMLGFYLPAEVSNVVSGSWYGWVPGGVTGD